MYFSIETQENHDVISEYYPKCGCGKEAEYLVYEHHEPHCKSCMKESIDTGIPALVQKI